MKLWVDDVRPAPPGYTWAKSVHEARIHICQMMRSDGTCKVELLDLDHDAGDYAFMGGDYIRLLDWLEEKRIFIPIHIHTMNPVGRENMRTIIRRNGWREIL